MGDNAPQLRSVEQPPTWEGAGEIPENVLRLVSLPDDRRSLLLQVSDLVDQIAFGTVVIVMHEGHITQIETSEKIRLPQGPP